MPSLIAYMSDSIIVPYNGCRAEYTAGRASGLLLQQGTDALRRFGSCLCLQVAAPLTPAMQEQQAAELTIT